VAFAKNPKRKTRALAYPAAYYRNIDYLDYAEEI
jgi:hypothetical protein